MNQVMIGITTMVATAALVCYRRQDGKPYVTWRSTYAIINEDHYEYGNDNFTMFAEGEHKKTDSRETMDKYKSLCLKRLQQELRMRINNAYTSSCTNKCKEMGWQT
jgi:hypothetical protein